MRKLSQEEANKLEFKSGIKRTSVVENIYREIGSLAVLESVLIEKSEWPLKTPPAFGKNTKLAARHGAPESARFAVRTLSNESGWVVTRVE